MPVKNNDDIKLLLESYRNTVELNTLLLERLGTLTDIHNEIRSKAEDRHVCLLQRILEVKDRMVSSFAGLKVQVYVSLVGCISIILLLVRAFYE